MGQHPVALLFRRQAYAIVLLLLNLVRADPTGAQSAANLEGSWNGGGSVSFASGEREAARCRAVYNRTSGTTYTLRAICATVSGRTSQTATLGHVGGNSYRGSFHNSDFDVSGTIYIVVAGNRQTVRLTSGAGTASFELRR